MDRLIVLSCVSMNEPTKETYFKYYLSNVNDLKNKIKKIKKIKKSIFDENIKEFYEMNGMNNLCPYINCDKYITPNYKNYNRIEGEFCLLDNILLIEEHTSYTFAYSINVLNLTKNNCLDLYNH
ncbi:hypothetical protein H012_gp879 [Acanthamoeba polyphaga moumouvirus]|uniref:Uncharacterized protein n=2 Tax=Moumouvirus TaxID=3080801 RepID=L7RBP3_9VIRU|nr:hypothetical protein H012_gp879 [Acanthamoeba polyphaga moumouvirus]AEX63287.1 hypothetical protein mv_R1085 [Moumouvirus Monve]AGC01587.1 hypothetical protein Moumou_00039 [Acanthamoeba polyphaga moumouvirus]AQN67911.1 hypothetical protein [Saudi moumouvirus]